MKQHITVEQLRGIPTKVLNKIVGFEVDEKIFLYDYWAEKQFTIGNMIKMIQDITGYPIKMYPNTGHVKKEFSNDSFYVVQYNLSTFLTEEEKVEKGYIAINKEKELCDSLWLAILRLTEYMERG